MKHFDIVVVGGGMVGASLALMLRPLMAQGLSVAIVDAQAIDTQVPPQPSFDARTSALSLGTQKVFEHLEIWTPLRDYCNPIEHIAVSQQGYFGGVKLHHDECLVKALGQVVENRYLGKILWQALEVFQSTVSSNLAVFAPAKLDALQMISQGAELSISCSANTEELTCSLVVLADGTNSTGCKLLGIEQFKQNYHQTAIAVNAAFDRPHNNWAYERFTPNGPLAMLPLTENRFGLVWCQSPEQANERLSFNDQDFKEALQIQVPKQLGRLIKLGVRQRYPLMLVKASEQVRRSVVVLGNAAHALHPVAGQGFNLALRDCEALANQITQDVKNGSIGCLKGLQCYALGRQSDQFKTITASHVLPSFFAAQGVLAPALRGIGMTIFDQLPLAKRLFARQAMGLVGTANPY